MENKYAITKIIFCVFISIIILGSPNLSVPVEAGSKFAQNIEPTPSPTPIITMDWIGLNGYPPNVNPLTGLEVSDPTRLKRRPIMVKVSNYPATGRPHAGLSYADIVFDYYIGEGANRFLALYYGQDAEKIGPVRSGRLVDPQLVQMYQGILAFAWADYEQITFILTQLGRRAITPSGYTCPGFCDEGTQTVTSLFVNSGALSTFVFNNGINNKPEALNGMVFSPTPPATEYDGKRMTFTYYAGNIADWRYNPSIGKYQRWIEEIDDVGKVSLIPLVDRLTNKQLAFDNVILIYADYTIHAPTLYNINITNNLQGKPAVVFRDGKAYDIIWKATGKDLPIRFYTLDGQPMPLKPGNTWMFLFGAASKIIQTIPGEWEITFDIP